MSQATLAQGQHLLKLVSDQKLPQERLRAFLDSGLMTTLLQCEFEQISRHNLQRLLMGLTSSVITDELLEYWAREQTNHLDWLPVKTKHASFQEAIVAGGYGHVCSDVTTENFKIQDGEISVDTEMTLLRPKRTPVTSEYALAQMEWLGLRPATLVELLALGETHRELQSGLVIICLGSSWVDSDGDRRVPCLGLWRGDRRLHLFLFDDKWNARCRFAAVRKSSA